MAVLSSPSLYSSRPHLSHCTSCSASSDSSTSRISYSSSNSFPFSTTQHSFPAISDFIGRSAIRVSNVFTHPQAVTVDKSKLRVSEGTSEDELWAAACLRVRSFNQFRADTFGVEDHRKYLAEHEFEAIKERMAGKRVSFKRVSCINATLPLDQISSSADDLSSACKYSNNGEDRVVVGTLDLNQCMRLPDEIAGIKPEGIGADFARAYLSNVCVAKELHRNGLGYELVAKAKTIAKDWAFDNEPAKNLYMKSGFVYESDEPTWQARFLDRPRRILLWTAISELII